MADTDDMDSPEVEMEEENEAEDSSPPEDEVDAGEEVEEGGEEDDEAQPVAEDVGEDGENDEAGEGEENNEEETGEAEDAGPQEEPQPEDAELEIRDEDEGRPVSSLSKKVNIALKTTVDILFSSQSVTFAPPPAGPAKAPGQNVIVKMIRGMWASREMLNESSDMQIVMKTTLRELIVYW